MNKIKTFFRNIRHSIIVKKLNMSESSSVLDTSCQDGTFLNILLGKNPNLKVSGIDMSQSDINLAKKLIPHGKFTVTDNKTLPFKHSVFDVVISSMTLHHMNDPVSSLLEMKRVLKKDGSVYLIDIISKGGWIYKILKHIKCPEPYHFEKWYTILDTHKLLEKVGLQIDKEGCVLVFPAASIVIPIRILKLKIV
jgi:ubiquinone/menaquinone biosynthesis C-methylase UbiE